MTLMIYKPQHNRLAALALIILIPVGGCIWGSVQYDRTLEKELIKNIGKMREVDSKVFFKYFLERHPIAEHHVVYYYFNEGEDINGFSIPIPIGTFFVSLPATSGNLQLSELWVLVNRQTEQVEDYVFLEGEEK